MPTRFSRFFFLTLFGSALTFSLAPIGRAADDEVAKAVPVAKPSEAKPKTPGTPMDRVNPKIRPLNATIDLGTGAAISGTLVEVDVVLLKTSFGEASVPLAEIAGIRFPQGDDVSTSVVMLNGDSITGATDVKMVTVDTDWGQAKINGSAIRSILLIPNLEWTSTSGISGKRWSLQEAKPQPGPTPASPGPGQPPRTTTTNPTMNSQGNSIFVPSGTVLPSRPGTVFPNQQ